MGWTDVFPVFTEEMVDDFETQATKEEKEQLETWYGTDRILNAQPDRQDIVSVSLFWKNVREGDPELPTPTREILQNAQAMGLALRFNPWDHYVRPLLEQVPKITRKFQSVVVRVYLAKDMEFLADELAAAGNEVHVMKSSSINFAPAGLWRFLPFAEDGKRVTVTDVDRLNDIGPDLQRTLTMEAAGVGAWRVPVPIDLTDDRLVCYLPFMGCQFGVRGGLMDVRKLLDAFTWHVRNEKIEPLVIFPGCGPLRIQAHSWPSYGFDEYFMTVVAYPRLAQHGMLTFVPSFIKSQILALDVEYVTWGNPNSELVYFPSGSCCGINMEKISEVIGSKEEINKFPKIALAMTDEAEESACEPRVALLFLTRGEMNHPRIWEEYVTQSESGLSIYAHTQNPLLLGEDSMLKDRQIPERFDTEWGSISLVRTTLALLENALADSENTHFVLASESCVPVRRLEFLLAALRMDSRSRMSMEPWDEVRRKNILKAQRVENIPGIRKEIAHFHSQWMCLNREDAVAILEKDWTRSFEHVYAPDEAYFATVLAASGRPPLELVANRPPTWTDWSEGGAHPKSFTTVPSRAAALIAESGSFFARKFGPASDIARWGLHLQ